MEVKNEQTKEFNEKGTLTAIIERQKRLSQIKERMEKKQNNNKISTGLEIIYHTLKKQNQLLLDDIKDTFNVHLPYNCDLKPDYIKPPYLTPKIISHKIERVMNIV